MSKLIAVRIPDKLQDILAVKLAERQVTVTSAVVNALWMWLGDAGSPAMSAVVPPNPKPPSFSHGRPKTVASQSKRQRVDVTPLIRASALAETCDGYRVQIGPTRSRPGSRLKGAK